jgi:hypothetical protein
MDRRMGGIYEEGFRGRLWRQAVCNGKTEDRISGKVSFNDSFDDKFFREGRGWFLGWTKTKIPGLDYRKVPNTALRGE